jgi:hypothetical protein
MRILEQDGDIDWNSCVKYMDNMNTVDREECGQKLATTIKATYKQSFNEGFPDDNGPSLGSKLQAMDGATYYILSCGIFYGGIFVDINGSEGPNKNGRDIFGFYYDNKPYDPTTKIWHLDPTKPISFRPMDFVYNGDNVCDKNHVGIQCTAHVIETGKMDYLK